MTSERETLPAKYGRLATADSFKVLYVGAQLGVGLYCQPERFAVGGIPGLLPGVEVQEVLPRRRGERSA